jgi:hypothetical protein
MVAGNILGGSLLCYILSRRHPYNEYDTLINPSWYHYVSRGCEFYHVPGASGYL